MSGILKFLHSGGAELAGGLVSGAAGMISAERQMKFQERMSNTAHQREIADLKKAGINPLLTVAGGGGSTTPSGAMHAPQNPAAGVSQNLRESRLMNNNVTLQKSEVAMRNAQIMEAASRVAVNDVQMLKIMQDIAHSEAGVANIEDEIDLRQREKRLTDAKTVSEKARAGSYQAQSDVDDKKADLYRNKVGGVVLPILDKITDYVQKVRVPHISRPMDMIEDVQESKYRSADGYEETQRRTTKQSKKGKRK